MLLSKHAIESFRLDKTFKITESPWHRDLLFFLEARAREITILE